MNRNEDTPNETEQTDEWGNPTALTDEQLPAAPADEQAAPAEPAAEEPAAPAFDPAEFRTEMDSKLTGVRDEIISALKPKEEPTPEDKEAWKPEKWDDFTDHAKEVYVKMREQEKAEEEAIRKQAQDEEQRINSAFDGMVGDLEKDGVLPKVADPENADDPGLRARAELYGYAAKLGTLDLKAAGTQLKEMHDNGFTFDPKAGKLLKTNPRPAGLDSPVGSSSRTTTAASSGSLDYRRMSWDELARRAKDDYIGR